MIYPEQKKLYMQLKKEDVPRPFKMRKLCMIVYLEPYKRMLHSGKFVHQRDFEISNVVTDINDLLMCCGNQYCGSSEADVYCWKFLTALREVSMVLYIVI